MHSAQVLKQRMHGQYAAACCSVLQCNAANSLANAQRASGEAACARYVRCSVLQCVAVCCSVLQCVAVRCRVLQCVAVCAAVD